MNALSPDEAREFASRWLPLWTGNRPEELATLYTNDLFYSDPVLREGLRGREAFLEYLRPLLRSNPDWVWRFERAIPLEDGFLNHWILDRPIDGQIQIGRGVCTVQLRQGLIYRNEVYFDMAPFQHTRQARAQKPPDILPNTV